MLSAGRGKKKKRTPIHCRGALSLITRLDDVARVDPLVVGYSVSDKIIKHRTPLKGQPASTSRDR